MGHFLRIVSSAMDGAVDSAIYQPFKTAKINVVSRIQTNSRPNKKQESGIRCAARA